MTDNQPGLSITRTELGKLALDAVNQARKNVEDVKGVGLAEPNHKEIASLLAAGGHISRAIELLRYIDATMPAKAEPEQKAEGDTGR